MRHIIALLTLCAAVAMGAALGCDRSEPARSMSTQQPGSAPAEARAVARIVFIDEEQACECTQNRIDVKSKLSARLIRLPSDSDIPRQFLNDSAMRA